VVQVEAPLSIGVLARQCGIRTSALRFWETEGLITPVGRTPAGYRLYDAECAARVRFILRAQALGLSLDEVHELLAAADGEGGSTLRDRLRHLVAHKLAQTRHQIGELEGFAAQLERVWLRLDGDGACACRHLGDCDCLTPSTRSGGRHQLVSVLESISTSECGCASECSGA
jgi:DNA-binding transcriptional MerR regulator